jgi:hypothetical protein
LDKRLLDLGLGLEVVASNELRDVIVILVVVVLLVAVLALLLLHALVALGKLAQRCERVGTELVEDAGDELGELLVFTVTVDGEGVRGYRGVDYGLLVSDGAEGSFADSTIDVAVCVRPSPSEHACACDLWRSFGDDN